MIINKGAINDIILTVTELTTITTPVYLFEFINKQTNVSYYCISELLETIGVRDRFTISETSTPDVLNGEIELPEGEYRYNVYQQTSTTNLDPLQSIPAEFTDYVEHGILDVIGSPLTNTSYGGANVTNTAYGS